MKLGTAKMKSDIKGEQDRGSLSTEGAEDAEKCLLDNYLLCNASPTLVYPLKSSVKFTVLDV